MSFVISDYFLNINLCTVTVSRLETKVLNYVHEEDVMQWNIITGISVSVCNFRYIRYWYIRLCTATAVVVQSEASGLRSNRDDAKVLL